MGFMEDAGNGAGEYEVALFDAKKLIAIEGLLFDGPESSVLQWRGNGVSEMGAMVSVVRQRPNALFEQIRIAAKGPLGECGVSDCAVSLSGTPITKYLVHVDFSSLFRNRGRLGDGEGGESAYGRATRRLVEEGFGIRDGNGWTWRYRIFDKSQSMAKDYVVAFIAETLQSDDGVKVPVFDRGQDGRSDLERRLCLGIDFTDGRLDVSWSKYFAYRGLYLSSGYRVELSGEYALNERTVLVMKSPRGTVGDASYPRVLKAVMSERGAGYDYVVYPQGPDDPEGIMDGVRRPQLFDGEGLVSPELAKQINLSLLQQDENASGKASSFQIRMPFAKGMLHEVDFRRFLKEEFGIGEEGKVKDAFGLERSLEDVHMVITTDMLKCHKWIAQWLQGRRETDPMRYYFEQFHANGHALYVSQTSDMLVNGGKTDLNWQFLSTLDLSPEEFCGFVGEHMRHFTKLRVPKGEEEREESRRFLLDDFDGRNERWIDEGSEDGEESPGDALGIDEGNSGDGTLEGTLFDFPDDGLWNQERVSRGDERLAWRYALRKSKRFIRDPYIRRKLDSAAASRFVQCSIGRFPVAGRMLYLSHDLMRLLVVLGNDCESSSSGLDCMADDRRICREGIRFLGAGEFYAPSMNPADAGPDGYCGILRNPHLSRSEQVLSKRFDGTGGDGLYDSYFGHLDGVLMVACDSEAPMALGGADYDGDLVRVYGDETVVKAIERGAYCENKDGSYRRRYAVADLSGPWVGDEVGRDDGVRAEAISAIGEHISYEQLESTFSGRIGRISNAAMRAGRTAYGAMPLSPEGEGACTALRDEDPCAKYSIATGMEIDAVKTGQRPDLDDILDVEDPSRDVIEKMGFLKYKEDAAPLLRSRSSEVFSDGLSAESKVELGKRGKPNRLELKLKRRWGSEYEEIFETVDYDDLSRGDPAVEGRYVSNLDRLPWLFAKERNASHGKALRASSKLFSFESEAGWEQVIDGEALDGVRRVLNAYRHAMVDKREFDANRRKVEQRNEFQKLCRIVLADPRWGASERIDTEAYLQWALGELTRWFGAGSRNGESDIYGLVQMVRGEKYDNWAFWSPDRRKAFVQSYLPPSLLEESPEERGSRFDSIFIQASYENGYMAMDYLLQSAIRSLELEKVMGHGREGDEGPGSEYGVSLVDLVVNRAEDPLLYHELIDIANWKQVEGRSWVEWNSRMVAACRERLDEVLGPHRDELVKYLVYLRNNKEYFDKRDRSEKRKASYGEVELFWSLLAPGDIDRYIEADAQL